MRLPKLDTLIIAVFFVCIALWMVSRCESKRTDYSQRAGRAAEEPEERPVRRDTVVVAPQPQPNVAAPTPSVTSTPATTTPSVAPAPTPAPTRTPAKTPSNTPAAAPPPAKTDNGKTTLYVTIDGLKLRKEPGLKSETVAQLKLFEEVYFLGKRTEWTQEISLGLEKVTDHWVKVRTKSGKEGWVFGAGVHYYKEKRKGVLQ